MRERLIRGDENRACDWRSISRTQTGYSQPIPKARIGGSPRFAARTRILVPATHTGGLRYTAMRWKNSLRIRASLAAISVGWGTRGNAGGARPALVTTDGERLIIRAATS